MPQLSRSGSRGFGQRNFDQVETWVFDLDNTLYPHHLLWQQVDDRIRAYVSEFLKVSKDEAFRVQKDYYKRYGTTMRGLMTEHGLNPDDYLDYVHQIDHSPLTPNPALGAAIEQLPGRKLVLTNGTKKHADAVMRRLDIHQHFEDVFDIIAAELEPKPSTITYERFLKRHGVDPSKAAMFEDLARNLEAPHALGMTTVLVVPEGQREVFREEWELSGRDDPHVDHVTDDLAGFLRQTASAPRLTSLAAPPTNRSRILLPGLLMSNDKLAKNLEKTIDEAFEGRDKIGPKTKGAVRKAVDTALGLLDSGKARVAERQADGTWHVNQWLKKAVLLSFRLNDMSVIPGGPGKAVWWDKVDSKFKGWSAARFRKEGFRAVPGCVVRKSAFIAPGVVLMPSFVNLGAYVGNGTMIDTWATVGSCAQIGKNVHLSGGVGIGGVLEPLQAGPVIIEDNCFIGARSEVVEGVIVREGSVLGMGVYLGMSTKIVDRATGKIHYGEVPPYSVVVSGTMPGNAMPGSNSGPSLYCAVIVKRVDERTRSKTSINELLRD